MLKWSPKFPDEVLHYQLDWAAAISLGDAITGSVTVTTAGSATMAATVVSTIGTVTTVELSGGTANTTGRVEFTAHTSFGETLGENVLCQVNAR